MTTSKLSEIALTADVVTGVTETTVTASAEDLAAFSSKTKIGTVTVDGVATELSAPAFVGDDATISVSTDGKFSVVNDVFASSIKDAGLDLGSMTLGTYLSVMTDALKGVKA